MRSFQLVAAFAGLVAAVPTGNGNEKRGVSSVVSGAPLGFASAVTGGGTVAPVHPTTIAQLKTYLRLRSFRREHFLLHTNHRKSNSSSFPSFPDHLFRKTYLFPLPHINS